MYRRCPLKAISIFCWLSALPDAATHGDSGGCSIRCLQRVVRRLPWSSAPAPATRRCDTGVEKMLHADSIDATRAHKNARAR